MLPDAGRYAGSSEANSNPSRLEKLYSEIRSVFGLIPDFFQVLSPKVDQLEAIWGAYKTVVGKSGFPEKVRGMIRYEVAKADGCPLCRDGHKDLLRMYGLTGEEIFLLDREIRETRYDEKTKNLLIYSYAIAENPHQERETIEAFMGLGLSREELLEVSMIVNLHRALLEIAHSLGIH